MKLYGLIGYPLSHSFSQKYFNEKFLKENIDAYYQLFPLKNIEEFPGLLKQFSRLSGINVTIPYKEQIIKYLDNIDNIAKEIGAVNTVKIRQTRQTALSGRTDKHLKKYSLFGYNTDVYGFYHSLKPLLKPIHKRALIFGTGGASKAVAYALKQLNIHFIFVSRNPEKNNDISYSDINSAIIKNNQIIINTTPLGMFPDINTYPPMPYESLTKTHILYDLVYNPEETLFLKFGKQNKAETINGLSMLKLQAEKSWEIWNNK